MSDKPGGKDTASYQGTDTAPKTLRGGVVVTHTQTNSGQPVINVKVIPDTTPPAKPPKP